MIKNLASYFLVLLLFSSCKKENSHDCFKSNGKEITELRTPGSFTKIEMNDKIEVTVFKGTEFKVEVIAGKNIIGNISTKVKEDVLVISNNNKCNFVRGYKKHVKVNVTLPYLYSILNNGVASLLFDEGFIQDSVRVRAESSGDIHWNGTCTYIKAESNGNGDIYLKGTCNTLEVYVNGTNFLKAEELSVSDRVFIQTLTKGDCFLNMGNLAKLEYGIFNDGNIYYKGNPANITGTLETGSTGQVIKED